MGSRFFVLAFLSSLALTIGQAEAQTARQVQMPPTLVYVSDFSEATGAGVEIIIELSNMSNIVQSGEVVLFNEDVRAIAFVIGASMGSSWIPTSPVSQMFTATPNFVSPYNVARQGFTGFPTNFSLAAARSSGSVQRIFLYFTCDIGAGGTQCRGQVPSGDTAGMDYFANRPPHSYPRSPNSECRLPGWWGKSIIPGVGNADQCFVSGAGNYDPNIHPSCERRAGDGIRPNSVVAHQNFLCKMEFFYRYGIRVNVNQARGAVVGSVTHRTFALGGGPSRVGLSHESIQLNGGRPF